MYYKFHSLTGNLLIAMPDLEDSYFAESVVLICDHDESGAMGLVVNRPMDISVANVLLQMKMQHNNPDLAHVPVLAGGPVKPEKGFILHYIEDTDEDSTEINVYKEWKNTLEINESLAVTTSDDIIKAIANSSCPEPYMIALGYCEWEAGQLEKEIKENSWLCTPLDLDILFNVPFLQRWRECTYNIGINDITNLSSYCGHA